MIIQNSFVSAYRYLFPQPTHQPRPRDGQTSAVPVQTRREATSRPTLAALRIPESYLAERARMERSYAAIKEILAMRTGPLVTDTDVLTPMFKALNAYLRAHRDSTTAQVAADAGAITAAISYLRLRQTHTITREDESALTHEVVTTLRLLRQANDTLVRDKFISMGAYPLLTNLLVKCVDHEAVVAQTLMILAQEIKYQYSFFAIDIGSIVPALNNVIETYRADAEVAKDAEKLLRHLGKAPRKATSKSIKQVQIRAFEIEAGDEN